ncbi:Uncharacterised protein (plasmid) [Mesomycoplasma conjunctivae]|nr:Uncharacterised protein [Mesomycoplasma conjunctivae]
MEWQDFDFKPIKWTKKKFIIGVIVFFIFLVITIILLFLPFKDGSTFELILKTYRNNKWDSSTIVRTISYISGWFFLVTKAVITISNWKMFLTKKKMFNFSVEQSGLDLKQEIKKAKKRAKENSQTPLLDELVAILQYFNVEAPKIGNIKTNIEEAINDKTTLAEKRKKITSILKTNSIDIETKAIKSD